MAAFGAVPDACVLYPARLRDTLLRAAEYGVYRVQWPDAVLDELHRNLVSDAGLSDERARRLINHMRAAFEYADVPNYRRLIDTMTNHPKDRHVVAAAVAGSCQVIVTTNLRHYPRAALEPFDIQAMPPDAFLVRLLGLDPEAMQAVIADQVRMLRRPPLTREQVLSQLAPFAPEFVRLVDSPDSPA